MSPDTIKEYMAQRATLVARLIELQPAWDGYAGTLETIQDEITRIDMIVGKQTFEDLAGAAHGPLNNRPA